MSGPQGHDPNQPWSSGQPQQPGSEEPSQWQQPAYSPQPYPQQGEQYPQQGEHYPGTAPQYQQPHQQHQAPVGPPTQYGPPGYDPGQYQQTQYQQGQYPPPETAKGSKRSLAVLGTVIGLLVAIIVAVVLVLGFWKPGFFVTTKLDVNKAQAGVQQILSDQVNGYGVKNVKDVKCNNGQNPTVKKGDTFTCDASVDGQHKQVTVTFQDDSGTYEVGRPKG